MNQIPTIAVSDKSVLRYSYFAAITTIFVTFGTLIVSVSTPPLSGPFCSGTCFEYPYHDIASRFPRDYYWMFASMLFSLVYLLLMVTIHQYSPGNRKIFSQMGLSLAIMASMVLFSTYFVQVSVIQPSLLNNETDGISMLTQFNPHGVFIAMEEAGYLLINLSLLPLIKVFTGKGKLKRSLQVVFLSGFLLAAVAFFIISLQFGIMREYIFEVVIISIVWLEIIISSVLMAVLFKRQLKIINNS